MPSHKPCLLLLLALLLVPNAPAASGGIRGQEFFDFNAEQFRRHQAAAKHGAVDSQYLLGTYYYHGQGVQRNIHLAIKWLRLSAKKGHADAQYLLGWIFDRDRDVPEDLDESHDFYLKAARQDHTEAQFRLALLLANAPGNKEDSVGAFQWASVAAARGQKRAAKLRDRLAAQLLPAQKLEADRQIRKFKNRRLGELLQGGDFQQHWQKAKDFLRTGDYDIALVLLKHCHGEAGHALKPNSLDMAGFLRDLATAHDGTGQFPEAIKLLTPCLTIFNYKRGHSKIPADTVRFTSTLSFTSRINAKLGRYDKALQQATYSFDLCKATFGVNHLETAASLANLGVVNRTIGNHRQAERLLRDALARLEDGSAPKQQLAFVLHNLAGLLRETGNYDGAEPLYKRCLKLREKIFGKNHPKTANTLYELALLYWTIGDTKKARPLLERCQKIWSVRKHPNEAIALSSIGDLYLDKGDRFRAKNDLDRAGKLFAQAGSLYARSHRVLQRTLGIDHPFTRLRLTRLAGVFRRTGHLSFAECLLNDNLNVLRGNHMQAGETLMQLARIAQDRGDMPAAEGHLQEALDVMGKLHSDNSTVTAEASAAMAQLKIIRDRPILARAFALKASESRRRLLAQVLSFASERQRLLFQSRKRHHDLLATLGDAPHLMDAILRTKGIVLDSLVEDQLAAEASLDPKIGQLLVQLRGASRRKDQLQLRIDQQIDANAITQRQQAAELVQLERKVEDLERELAQNAMGIDRARRGLNVQTKDVQAQLPVDGALVEFIEFRRYEPNRWRVVMDVTPENPQTGKPFSCTERLPYLGYEHLGYPGKSKDPLTWLTAEDFKPSATPDLWERHYGALVLGPKGEPTWVPLGTAEKIDFLLSHYDPTKKHQDDKKYAKTLSALHTHLIAPVAKVLPFGTRTLILAPDGRLNLLNFATLLQPPARGYSKFLCESYLLKYVSTGRDLLKATPTPANTPRQLVIFANPRFDDDHAAPPRPRRSTILSHSMDLQALRELKFPPLPGTAEEAKFLTSNSGKWKLKPVDHLGANATEKNLYALQSPHILHLATHGFFLPASKAPATTPLRNPMHNSGLALAGAGRTLAAWRAGRTPPTEDDGILTAAEVGTLRLRQTWLVVLSACQSGTGEVLSGEGVLGLRRGFIRAGTRHLLMTLWPVSDKQTFKFMKDFYSHALAKNDPPDALHTVQRNWLTSLRRDEGLKVAVQIAGPFLLSSQGGGR